MQLIERDPRLPPPGTKLEAKGQTVLVLEDGFEHQGQRYASLSAVAKAITGATAINGFAFFKLGTVGSRSNGSSRPAPARSNGQGLEVGAHFAQDEDGKPNCTEWVKSGDPRGLRELKPGSEFGIYDCEIGGRLCRAFIRVGKTDPKTGAITVYSYESRLARTPEETPTASTGCSFTGAPLSPKEKTSWSSRGRQGSVRDDVHPKTERRTAMRFGPQDKFWMVVDARSEESILGDLLFETSLEKLYLQFKGGLTLEDDPTIFTDEKEAKIEAFGRLTAHRAARAILRQGRLDLLQQAAKLEIFDGNGRRLFQADLRNLT